MLVGINRNLPRALMNFLDPSLVAKDRLGLLHYRLIVALLLAAQMHLAWLRIKIVLLANPALDR